MVAEAPPPGGKNYFYLPRKLHSGKTIDKDALLPTTIFNQYFKKIPESVEEYKEMLNNLKEMGAFLIDIINDNISIQDNPRSIDAVRKQIPKLKQKIKKLNIIIENKDIVFLISTTDYLNDLKLNFPDSVYVMLEESIQSSSITDILSGLSVISNALIQILLRKGIITQEEFEKEVFSASLVGVPLKKKDHDRFAEKFEEKMREITKDVNEIISHPDVLKELQKKGVKFNQSIKTLREKFEENVEKQKNEIETIWKLIQPPLNVPNYVIMALYHEIIDCITFGVNGAAITLLSIMAEYILKYASHIKEYGANDKDNWEEFETITFHPAIDRAFNNNLITDEEKNELIGFKNDIRNPYNHYNIQKITKDYGFKNTQSIGTKKLDIKTEDLKAKDNPFIRAQTKREYDALIVFNVFGYVIDLVEKLWHRLDELK